MSDWLKNNIGNVITVTVIIVTFGTSYIVTNTRNETRISALEARQDRQATALTNQQVQITNLANDVSGMKALLTAMNDNLTYIRNRIDRITS